MNFILTGATIIDGTGNDPLENGAVHIQDGKIAWVGSAHELPDSLSNVPQQDATGKFIIPGIIDAHIHVCWNGRAGVLDLIQQDRDTLLLEAVATVKSVLQSGTTTVRDIGGHYHIEMSLRKAIEAGHIIGPRMRVSGRIICMTGGHGHFIALEADGPDEVRKAAREQIKAGADTIKMMATGGVATPGQDIMASQLTVEEMQAAVEAAHALGRTVATHCHGTQGIKNSLLAGVDSIEHCTYLDEETADMMAERGSSMVLTLGVGHPDPNRVADHLKERAQQVRDNNQERYERMGESIRIGREKGVLIGSGTDAGGNELAPHDFSMARELELLVENGFAPMEALTIATRNNAQILRWDDQLGTLETGKLADFVVLSANPLEDITNVRQIDAVYKGGQKVSSE